MRKITKALLILFLFQGCSTLSREAGYPGGNVGYLADRHALFAKGHEQQVNRYFVTLALVAPLVAETVETSSEAKLSAERIKELYKNIEKLKKASKRCALPNLNRNSTVNNIVLSNCGHDNAASADGSALSFESLSYEVSKSLNDSLKQAFDNLEIRSNVGRLMAFEPTEILKTILKSRHLIPVLSRYLSAYRDISIVFGQSVAESCVGVENDVSLKKACKKVAESFVALVNRKRTMDDDAAKQERPISAVFNAGEHALNAGLDWELTSIQRIALLHHVNRACRKLDALAKIDDENYDGCTIDLETLRLTGGTSVTQKAVNGLIAE